MILTRGVRSPLMAPASIRWIRRRLATPLWISSREQRMSWAAGAGAAPCGPLDGECCAAAAGTGAGAGAGAWTSLFSQGTCQKSAWKSSYGGIGLSNACSHMAAAVAAGEDGCGGGRNVDLLLAVRAVHNHRRLLLCQNPTKIRRNLDQTR